MEASDRLEMTEVEQVSIPTGEVEVQGTLAVPRLAMGMILIAHGSCSSRHSARNRHVARNLQAEGFGTLLMNLLSQREEASEQQSRRLRFDVELLAERVTGCADWLAQRPGTAGLQQGVFGSSTGAAAALIAAARQPDTVAAVVSRGGRPDLAMDYLDEVQAPTLLIVGGYDFSVIEMNKRALERIPAEKKLELVPGASHLFEEPDKLDEVARLSIDWFRRWMA